MSSDTVNPMPATVAAPTSGGHGTVRGKPPNRGRVTSQVHADDAERLADDQADARCRG